MSPAGFPKQRRRTPPRPRKGKAVRAAVTALILQDPESLEGDIVNAFVKIHPEEKRYDLRFTLMLNMATTMEAGHQTLVSDHKEEGHDTHAESEANVPLDTGRADGSWLQQLSDGGRRESLPLPVTLAN